ncbi:response regulator [Maridesulfovibrio frigidus]|uniref:response regulator n=1 Tax=Maridesulfovibrio frigidus TaxID=340956 RepID=UPI0004E1E027|nr:response regulator [Maridesulfovibrio frigidus]
MSKILVIDDEKATLSMFKMLLSVYGHEVLTAENGEVGIELFAAEKPDLVMTDIKMPGMDGLQVLGKIKAMSPDAEVIVITGHGDMELAIKALNLDATDFLNKPVKREDLEKALQLSAERKAFVTDKQDEVQIDIEGDIAVINVMGSLTSKSDVSLNNVFDKAFSSGCHDLILVFQEKSSINGGGMDTLVESIEKARDHKCKVHIAGLSDNFQSVFESMGISSMASMSETEDEARSKVQAS